MITRRKKNVEVGKKTNISFQFQVKKSMFPDGTVYLPYLILFAILQFARTSMNCIHDSVPVVKPESEKISLEDVKSRRPRSHGDFEPIKIHYHFDDVDPSVSQTSLDNVDLALRKAIAFLADTLKVKRTKSPFRIGRTACVRHWATGANKFKCSQAKFQTEFCSINGRDYIIPDLYLQKLDVYDIDHPNPIHTYREGVGVEDVNFILFITFQPASWCKEKDVLAYGSYCRLDQLNRPAAGLLNLCPEKFSHTLYKPHHYYNVIMHELIHILGFSSQLYPKYKTCSTIDSCTKPKKIIVADEHSVKRIVLPEVVESMQVHFSCSGDEFGAPLAKNEQFPNVPSSHWHPLLMYTSIMTPVISEDDYIVIDNITLALLGSTGWYIVNFPKKNSFTLGKGAGCNFGFEKDCKSSKNLCVPDENLTGCDILFFTYGKCEKVVPYHPCGVFKPNVQNSCYDPDARKYEFSMNDLEEEHRCVTVQEGDDPEKPTCAVLRCISRNNSAILLDHEWVPCGNNTIKVNQTVLTCAPSLDCEDSVVKTEKPFCERGNKLAIAVRIYLDSPALDFLNAVTTFKVFKVNFVRSIASKINIPVNLIVNSTLSLYKEVYMDFSICPPDNIDNAQLGRLISQTQQFLDAKSFTNHFRSSVDVVLASHDIQLTPETTRAFSDHEGVNMMLVIIPTVLAVLMIASFAASIIRYVVIQRHRPKRLTSSNGASGIQLDTTRQEDPTSSRQ